MHSLKKLSPRSRYLLLLAVLCLCVRAFMWIYYAPNSYPDSNTYRTTAEQIRSLDFNQYLGNVPPVYPLLLVLSGENDQFVWIIQSMLGLGISLLLFFIAFDQSHRASWAFWIGLSYTLSLNLLFFEANILTETLATFFLVLSVWIISCLYTKKEENTRYYLYLGIVTALAVLTRSALLYLIPVYLLFWLFQTVRLRWKTKVSARMLMAYLSPILVLVLSWSYFNKVHTNTFNITTMTGYYLTNHSGGFIEFAPEEFATLRDIYIKYRTERIEETGTHSVTFSLALPEMLSVTGLTYAELSKVLTRMSLGLFLTHPDLYIKSVLNSWQAFWQPFMGFIDLGNFHSSYLKYILRYVQIIETWVAKNLVIPLFLFISLWLTCLSIARKTLISFSLIVIWVVLLGSIAQALVEYSENARYAIPFQPLILLVVLLWIFNITRLAPQIVNDHG